MARIVLKDPKQPSLKKTHKPLSLRYKQWLKISLFFNFWLLKLVVYLLYKPFFNALFFKILNNIKRLV